MTRRPGHIPGQSTPSSAPEAKNVDAPSNGATPRSRDTVPECVRVFETRWAEAQWLREVMSGIKEGRRSAAPRDSDTFFAERVLSRRDLVHRRLTNGFECFGEEVGGRFRKPFKETGLRSDQSHVLRRIVQLTPRISLFMSGRTKDIMTKGDSKLLSLDNPWIVMNGKVRGVFRIDLDVTFPSWDALRYEIEQLRLPCLPHIVVAFELPDGRIERPHVIYLLPYQSSVWFDPSDPRCRRDIMSLWRGVHAGITKEFLPLGADPGALSNAMRIKNPLSPFWSYRTWNETIFPDLSEWAGWVDTTTSRTTMIRESAAALSGMERKASNVLFTTLQEWVFALLRDLHNQADQVYILSIASKDRDRLAEKLFNSLVGRASSVAENPKQAQAILYRVTTYAADHWDPSRVARDASRDRGACAPDVDGVAGTARRQAIGGRYAAALRASRAAETLRSAVQAALAEGAQITKSEIARRSGLSRPTVLKHWAAVEPLIGAGTDEV